MLVHYRVLYLSMQAGVPRDTIPQAWWDAFKFTRAVKSARINGFCHVPNRSSRQRIDEKNVAEARIIFGRWLLSTIESSVDDRNYVIVPVPSKDAVIKSNGPYRHSEMIAEALARQKTKPQISDFLRYTEKLTKASEGGPRYFDQIYPKLRVCGDIPDRPIVLVDDVVTRGGHLRAAKRRIEEAGGSVLFGVVCGRTVLGMDDHPWTSSTLEVSEEAAIFDFDW